MIKCIIDLGVYNDSLQIFNTVLYCSYLSTETDSVCEGNPVSKFSIAGHKPEYCSVQELSKLIHGCNESLF